MNQTTNNFNPMLFDQDEKMAATATVGFGVRKSPL